MRPALRFLLIVAGLFLVTQAGVPLAGAEPPPSVTLIEEAYRRGEIDRATALLYKAYTIVAPERLPAAFQSPTPGKDATLIILRELQASWALLGPAHQLQLAELGFARADGGAIVLARPSLSGEMRYDTPHFVVHYAASGPDRPPSDDANHNGIPDYVEDVGREMEKVWVTELTSFGWLQPPPDGTAGGDNRYDVYLEDMGYYGYTASDGFVGDNPNSPGVVETRAAMSYIALENDYDGFPNTPLQDIQVTGAHEFNHAIQFSYDSEEPADWLWESVATWMEDEVYDDVNDNASYLSDYFDVPDLCLPAEGTYPQDMHWYADWIFWRYVSEHYGGQATVRKAWESAVFYDDFAAVRPALASAGADMPTVFNRFAATNLIQATCPADDPYCYREPWLYPDPVRERTINYTGARVTYDATDGVQTDYSTDYVTIRAGSSIRVSVAGKSAGTQYGAQLVGRGPGGAAVLPLSLSGNPLSGSRVVDAGAYSDLVLVITNLTESGSCGDRRYRVTVECGLLGDVSGDGQVTAGDIMEIQADWHNPNFAPAHDLDSDGAATVRDVQLAAREWGQSCS